MTPPEPTALALILVLWARLAGGYSFQNCIQSPTDPTSFSCVRRGQSSLASLVSDLPQRATQLNASHNLLTRIPAWSFSHLPRLLHLRLDSNSLSALTHDGFGGLGQLRSLDLSSNRIQLLGPGAFSGLGGLAELLLAGNRLEALGPESFGGSALASLQNLSLRSNRLESFSQVAEAVAGMAGLRVLDLCGNRLQSLGNASTLPASLTHLYLCQNRLASLGCRTDLLSRIQVLDLSSNSRLSSGAFRGLDLRNVTWLQLRFTGISASGLLNASSVDPGRVDYSGLGLDGSARLAELCVLLSRSRGPGPDLVLQDSGLSALADGTFSGCPPLRALDLSRNVLKRVGCLAFLRGQESLETLAVEHNRLSRLTSCAGAPPRPFGALRTLSYRYNRILSVSGRAFAHTPGLTTLSLNINSIAYLDRGALRGLRQLQTLRLDNNLLTDLYNCSFLDLHRLHTLNLRNNRIAVVFAGTFQRLAALRILDLGGNKITHFQPGAFAGLASLANLYLDRNALRAVDGPQLAGLGPTLRVLDLSSNMIRYAPGQAAVSPFLALRRLRDLKLDEQRPYGMSRLPPALLRGLSELRSLRLSGNQITDLPPDAFDDLRRLERLCLDNSHAGVARLRPGVFKNLRRLRWLSAENTGLQQLSRNVLQQLDASALARLPALRFLDLRRCPLSCTCANRWLQNWTLRNAEVQVVRAYGQPCPDHSGAFFHSFDTQVCFLDVGLYLFSCSCPLVLLLTALPLLHAKLYWRAKYGLYVCLAWLRGSARPPGAGGEGSCDYDAFISYNSADEAWVQEELLPNLEGPGGAPPRLCLHHRDFEPGRAVVDNIVDAVYRSRLTVGLVSRHYLRSEWCSLEVQLASYRLFQELRDVLLLVFLEDIPEWQLSAYHRMRKVVLRKTYLQWPGPGSAPEARALFWSRLRRALRSSEGGGVADKDGGTSYFQP
ncbi:TLR13 protein, partial [Atractosteus spatula]|nr:TLR13 protein [Atractosteus spatula]